MYLGSKVTQLPLGLLIADLCVSNSDLYTSLFVGSFCTPCCFFSFFLPASTAAVPLEADFAFLDEVAPSGAFSLPCELLSIERFSSSASYNIEHRTGT